MEVVPRRCRCRYRYRYRCNRHATEPLEPTATVNSTVDVFCSARSVTWHDEPWRMMEPPSVSIIRQTRGATGALFHCHGLFKKSDRVPDIVVAR